MQKEGREKREWRTEEVLMRHRMEMKRILEDMVRTEKESMRIYSGKWRRKEAGKKEDAARALLVLSEEQLEKRLCS